MRRVEGVTRADRVRNEDIRRELDQEAVLSVVDRKKNEYNDKSKPKIFVGHLDLIRYTNKYY